MGRGNSFGKLSLWGKVVLENLKRFLIHRENLLKKIHPFIDLFIT